jgi:hypothetical protein
VDRSSGAIETGASTPIKESEPVSIEADVHQDLSLNEEDAENVMGGRNRLKKKTAKPASQHAAAAEVDTQIDASGGGWQAYVDDPSEDC